MSEIADTLPDWLQGTLTELLRLRGHALLVEGPSGLGQYELALALSAAWLCEQPKPTGACGHCPSCHSIRVRTHPDLCVLMPESLQLELGWPMDEQTQAELDSKKRKPSKEIRVQAMREAVVFSQRTSSRGRGKVVLVYPAERMNGITANTLLKTLEEPPGDVRFVLASEAAWKLLPTVRSRCMSHAMPWPDTGHAVAWLKLQGVPESEASVLLRAAGGRPQDALALAGSGVTAEAWTRLPKAVRRAEVAALGERTPAQAIEALQKLCHDLLAQAVGAEPRFFAAADLPSPPPMRVLSDWSHSLTEAAKSAEHTFNPGLMLESLVSQASVHLNSGGNSKRP
ncbi:DNA polymerase III subunit delta' [Variovorax dokdonensis]|uniref:DNA polymerase III subunit delta n=1 Tax=Variovorax dokdonensis TaxID=344883 RepID=A0ABT7NGV8_9BURK|nr:DNA polymerase III subunit delta' [Variovorax dokdonensis]MDM0047125.1 DNA polymerase III subunit delta' [Variovorax dokdonensis]